jgi:hypothetical protein
MIAIVRRLDLDGDARISRREFFDAIRPMENFTIGSMHQL